ncbi:ABC transporter substrate-binding protein [Tsukamurella sp. PLM1]|uniref:ABC transporter substrate-binding protein n=1 Tax=Tsukamurella sp. PLM1 TaxID=2929795 RepID=UPI0020523519|nr:ABC transporter substrate-binding protein [Tsukamurella sp. PLM1]BDH55294.1 hypothetical protein MTP03_02330 [Tsukamurella sp. PLM1]
MPGYGGPGGPGSAPKPKGRKPLLIGGAAALVVVLAVVLGFVLLRGGDGSDGPALDAWSARTVTDVNGETKLDSRPERIVALGAGDAELVSALGFDVAAGANGPKSEMPSWVPALKDVPTAGTSTDPDKSAIEKAKPDLIINTDPAAAEKVKDLKSLAGGRAIAVPTAGSNGWTWQEQLTFIAEALGAKDRAAAVKKTYEAKITELRSAHPDFNGKKLDVVHFNGSATMLATSATNPFQLLGLLGFSMQTPGAGSGSAWLTLGTSDFYKAVSSSEVDRTIVARTDAAAGNGGYDGLPSSLTYGVPIVIVDKTNGVDALVYGGPLALDAIESQVLPAIAKGIK